MSNSNKCSEEHFDSMREKVYQRIIRSRQDDVNQTKLGYERIEKKFEELEEKIAKLTELKQRKSIREKYILIIVGAIILFILFVLQMIFFREREWRIFS
ncbi:hypothetical protein LOD99_16094 [Oopsacas minuta]|uniref:Uncharacterized protein n=1 Tax=Oopsacas minuta TaxID=111878 RepID=A0AAV7K715_9METZ|nr:hypothetical protein LOD99_16094 [Oopsacas minuta]